MPEPLDGRSAALVGRDAEAIEVERLLREHRLVSVVGPGGVGKSALAADVVRRMLPGPWAAVAATDLAGLETPGQVPHWMACALRLWGRPRLAEVAGDRPRLPVVDTSEHLAEAVGDRPTLLVVDTCEHLAEECADVLVRLVEACAGMHVLVTSRVPLRTPAGYPLPPLAPEAAATLFSRAALRFGASVTPESELARRICTSLDGLPLAVHLAAGGLAHRTPDELLPFVSRLRHVLDLTSPVTPLPSRQRTLRASLSWSHRLCTPDERLLWARCSVFDEPFTLRDALAVCSDEWLAASPLVTAFAGLAAQSVITPEPPPHPAAFRMPRVTRAYGRQRLELLGEEDEFERRCAAWCVGGR
ncbi:ATP-binding protein [Streptomyces varsoviensis]|nr:NB-ARC domain-containing protein [Streptomyces varsoviensis]